MKTRRFFFAHRAAAAVLPAAAFAAFLAAGCDNKPEDTATQGAYGEPVASAPAASPAATVPTAAQTGVLASPASTAPGATVPTDTASPAPVAPPMAGAIPPSGGPAGGAPPMNAPFAGGMGGDPNAPLTPTPDLDKIIAGLEKGADKKALAAAYAARGHARMHDDPAGARVKYRRALEDYRVALKNDPTNQTALTEKDQIESIYRSMGRPIPGEETTGAGAAKK